MGACWMITYDVVVDAVQVRLVVVVDLYPARSTAPSHDSYLGAKCLFHFLLGRENVRVLAGRPANVSNAASAIQVGQFSRKKPSRNRLAQVVAVARGRFAVDEMQPLELDFAVYLRLFNTNNSNTARASETKQLAVNHSYRKSAL